MEALPNDGKTQPTFIRTNLFTAPFQGIVNTYGTPRHVFSLWHRIVVDVEHRGLTGTVKSTLASSPWQCSPSCLALCSETW